MDRLVARSFLEPMEFSIFLSVAQRDSMALALASLRVADSMLGATLAWSGNRGMESLSIMLNPEGPQGQDSTFNRRLGECASAVQDTFVPYRGGAGFSPRALPKGCWPALDSALVILLDVDVSIIHWFHSGLMGVGVSTDEPVDRYALASYLGRKLGVRVWPGVLMTKWPPLDFKRVAEGWQFTLMRGYGDCLSGCIHRRYFPFLYDPSTGTVTKLPEHGDPWPPPTE